MTETAQAIWLKLKKQLNTSADIQKIIDFLNEQGTFEFKALETGLFPAAIADEYTGYDKVWVRDNVHVAHAHRVMGKHDIAVKTTLALAEFFQKYRQRFDAAIAGEIDLTDVTARPHIRFDGITLSEVDEKWAHAQNDALGYFVWILCELIDEGRIAWSDELAELLGTFVLYFLAISYWVDEDSGHWEEVRKIAASSIGCVVAGLEALKHVVSKSDRKLHSSGEPLDGETLDKLIENGRDALHAILPAECIQENPKQNRRYDGALLFLIYPLDVIEGEIAETIVNETVDVLSGDYGIRRYLGDSYWCSDYKDVLAGKDRTADFSENLDRRDSFLKEDEEAQWCIFDSIISIYYARRYQKSADSADREKQLHHLRRALSQLTDETSEFGPFRGPESYYLCKGKRIPNDITPLLWTQGNLRMALEFAKTTGN